MNVLPNNGNVFTEPLPWYIRPFRGMNKLVKTLSRTLDGMSARLLQAAVCTGYQNVSPVEIRT
jgi:hypothetical protein